MFCENPSFIRFVSTMRFGATVPSRKRIATTLLKTWYDRGCDEMEKYIEKSEYLTLGTDAWTNVAGNSIINYVAMNSESILLLNSVDTKANRH